MRPSMIPAIRTKITEVFDIVSKAQVEIQQLTGVAVKLNLVTQADAEMHETLHLLFTNMLAIWGTPAHEIKSKIRVTKLVAQRQLFCLVAKKLYGDDFSLDAIGKQIGYKDHTAVLHGINKAAELLAVNDDKMVFYYNQIKHLVNE